MKKSLQTIVITGATASGKTEKAISLAKKYNAEIICADSKIVYKGFDIVSAKPTLDEQESVPHHLIDILEPRKLFSAGDFVTRAKGAMRDIKKRGKNVIIAGGTWFYIKSLLDEEALPKIPQNPQLRSELSEKTKDELWDILDRLDPKRATLVHRNNIDKVIRSIEMCKFLNSPISNYRREKNDSHNALWFAPKIEREDLYGRINTRVDMMFDSGLEYEFRKIYDKYGANEVVSSTIGYKEFLEFQNMDEVVEKIKQHTRNFAKRQLTWLRGNDEINLVDFDKDFEKDFLEVL